MLDDDELRNGSFADIFRRGSPSYLALAGLQHGRERGLEEYWKTRLPHIQPYRHHVVRTGNDQTVAATGEHKSPMPPHIHLSRQTAPTAVGGRRNCWYVYTYLTVLKVECRLLTIV